MKAYKNQEFLMSPEARLVRILSEYLEPKARFEKLGVHNALIFFGSARIQPGMATTPDGLDYYDMARQLARRMARWTTEAHQGENRFYICTGGGPGIMEAANRGAAEENPALSMGLNISLPFEQDSNAHISQQLDLEFHYFFLRKFWFLNLARGLVIFPGGFGTMDELFEVLT
ncbi:MAG: LOG family protein, partial [Nevskiales bacterium]